MNDPEDRVPLAPAEGGQEDSSRWKALPEPIPPELMTTGQPSHEPADPDWGRDPNQEWMIRYS